MNNLDLGQHVDMLRTEAPLVHCITNYVTVNDCANAVLAVGASPIMSEEPDDVVDISNVCSALTLNIGTLNKQTIEGMHIAGKQAAALDHPIVLDPVGAGASKLRTATAVHLLDTLPIAVIRGNMSEAKALAGGSATTRGVDVCTEDIITPDKVISGVIFAKELSAQTNSIVAITGPVDIVANADKAYAVFNGSPLQERITGAGCMLSCMVAAYAALGHNQQIETVLASVVSMGLAGQIAEKRMQVGDGNGSYRTYLLDALYTLDGEALDQGARVEAY